MTDAVDRPVPIFEEGAAGPLPLERRFAMVGIRKTRSALLDLALHTLKGRARLAGALRLGERAHRMESDIESLGSEGADRKSIEQLLTRFDALQATFDALRAADDAVQTELVQRATAATSAPKPVELPVAVETPAGEKEEAVPAATRRGAQHSRRCHSPSASGCAHFREPGRAHPRPLARQNGRAGGRGSSRARGSKPNWASCAIARRFDKSNWIACTSGCATSRCAESGMRSRLAQAKDSQQGFDTSSSTASRACGNPRMMAESVNDVATQRTLRRRCERRKRPSASPPDYNCGAVCARAWWSSRAYQNASTALFAKRRKKPANRCALTSPAARSKWTAVLTA